MRPRAVIGLALACCALFAAAPGGATGAVDDEPGLVRLDHRLPWQEGGLELFLWSLKATGGRVEIRFGLRLEEAAAVASTAVGYPRYRAAGYRWSDAVTTGMSSRTRVVQAGGGKPRQVFFSVLVPLEARTLVLPIGEEDLRFELQDWFAMLPPESRRPPSAEPEQPRPGTRARVESPGTPVRLDARVRWEGKKPFGDGALDAGESGALLLDVANQGDRPTRDVRVRLHAADAAWLSYPDETLIPEIDPGRTETVTLPFRAGAGTPDATLVLNIEVKEQFGHDAPPVRLEVATRARARSELVVMDDFAVEGARLPVPRDKVVTVRLRVRNVGQGTAHGAVARVRPEPDTFQAREAPLEFRLGDLAPGDIGEVPYRCYANQRAEVLGLRVDLSDDATRSRPAGTLVTIPLDGTEAPRVVRVRADDRQTITIPAPPPALTSDIDLAVPRSPTERPQGLAVVLGVEEYANAPSATHAAEDARTARAYFEHALGVPGSRIEFLVDDAVTLAQFHRIFGPEGWLARRTTKGTDIFVFFAGHGFVSSGDRSAYLMPSDADVNYVRQTGYAVDTMLHALAELDSRNVTVFLDACFSGMTRLGEPISKGARPLALVPVRANPRGISLYSAAGAGQTAGTLDEQGHGLFTYYLFRGLSGPADRNGDRKLLASELKQYLEAEVPRAAALSDREQAPSISLEDATQLLTTLP